MSYTYRERERDIAVERQRRLAIRPVRLLRVWISEGLTQADSQF